jgi:hypothetical protein
VTKKQAQATFDYVSAHLLTQMKQSKDQDGGCVYRGNDPDTGAKLMCAVGCLIPDEHYSTKMEGFGPSMLPNMASTTAAVEWLRKNITPHEALLDDLQEVHDMHHPNQWREQLTRVAQKYGLEGPTA